MSFVVIQRITVIEKGPGERNNTLIEELTHEEEFYSELEARDYVHRNCVWERERP